MRIAPLFLLLCCLPAAYADDGVSPYRPSVSSPAQLPLAGQLEFELGGLASRQDGSRRNSVPVLFKLAFSEQWGVLLGGEALVAQRDADGRQRGLGDLSLVLKRAFIVDDNTAFGLELGGKLPTARVPLGSGKRDFTLNGIYSKTSGAIHMDLNANLTALGAVDAGSGHTQSGLSASFSGNLNEQWTATTELSGTRRRAADNTAQWLLAFSYSPSKQLTVDAGLAKGLNKASPDWSLFTGLVVPLTKLW